MLTPQDPINQIRQTIDQNQGQAIGQMSGGMAVGQLIVYLSQTPTETTTAAVVSVNSVNFEQNPYQGLQAFREMDGDRFFGRSREIQELVDRFQQLQVDRATVRVLPIYGPSGSGKSSLARAGLIPALGQPSLPRQQAARVLVLTPGAQPLEALATVLARIATHDPTPATKTREFATELRQKSNRNECDGLRRLASIFPDIDRLPMIILVDQFEEIYTLCKDEAERNLFVENLLCAASDSAQHISVILTLRSDFLGMTHQHPHLNQLFSSQGFLVPMMQRDQLAIAITEPAKRAGYELDKATVQLLLEQAEGQEGVLPLLQFALTEIWEGLRQGIAPADTLEKIGGVGGALANKTKSLYESLSDVKKNIARSLFLALIELHEDYKSTRRRVSIAELVTRDGDEIAIRETIDCFAKPGVWILVTSCNEQQIEMVEIAHEALIRNWQDLQEWLKLQWEALRKQRKIEEAARDWQDHHQSKDYLLQGRSLRDAKELIDNLQESDLNVSISSLKFIKTSLRNQKVVLLKSLTLYLLLPVIILHALIIGKTDAILGQKNYCAPDIGIRELLGYMWWTGNAKFLKDRNFCLEQLSGVRLTGIFLSKSNFNFSDISNASFRDSTFAFGQFQGATLVNTDFENTILTGSDFRCENIKCSILIRTNFKNADLQLAKFQGASMEGVILKGTNLKEANLSNVKGLTAKQLEGALLCETTLPNDFRDDFGNLISENRDCALGSFLFQLRQL